MERTADILLKTGLDPNLLERASSYAEEADIRLLSACCELGYLTETDALTLLGQKLGVPHIGQVDLQTTQYCFDVIGLDMCQRHMVLPILKFSRTLLLVMQDPCDRLVQHTLEFHSGRIIKPIVSLQRNIRATLDAHDVDHVIADEQIVSVSLERVSNAPSMTRAPREHKNRKAEAVRHLKLGLEALKKSQWSDAMEFFQESVRFDPFDARPHLYLARLQDGLDKPVDALASYRRVLSIDEHHARARSEMDRLVGKLSKGKSTSTVQ